MAIPELEERPRLLDLAILSVATNRYLDYWKKMALSADRFLQPGAQLAFYVFTDRPDEVGEIKHQLRRSRIVPIEVPPLEWPDATLLRYELFTDAWGLLEQELVMHLDADMVVSADCMIDPREPEWPGGIAFVRHPGFRRPSLRRRVNLYAKAPEFMCGDFQMRLRYGSLGSWEKSRESRAFVPRRDRRVYVCGGTWMGLREPLGLMIRTLAARTREDLNEGTIAVWHDESHLNWFSSRNSHYLFDSEKCFAPGYKNLADLTPEIIAVDKGTDRTR